MYGGTPGNLTGVRTLALVLLETSMSTLHLSDYYA